MKKVLILGGGFGGVAAFRQLHKQLHPVKKFHAQVELVNRENYFTFSPMLHEAATGSVAREHVAQSLREILVCCGQDFHQATVTRIDPEKRIVETQEGIKYPFDILIIALGVGQGFFATPGAKEHALPLKQLPDAVMIRNRIIRSFEHASETHDLAQIEAMKRYLRFVIVGGGATGTELAGQLADLMDQELSRFYGDVPVQAAEIILVHAGERLLEQLSEKGSNVAKERLEALGVHVRLKERVTEVHPDRVTLASGMEIPTHNVFWTAGTDSIIRAMVPNDWINDQGLILVNEYGQIARHPNIYAIGDCATAREEAHRFPPTAQGAVQEAHIAAKNIAAFLTDRNLTTATFQYRGDIIPLGDWFGIYERHTWHMHGLLAWLLRRAVFLQTMTSWKKRTQVLFDWITRIFLPRDTSEL